MDVLVSVVTTTITATVAIIAVVVISSPLAPFDLHGLAFAAQAQELRSGSNYAVNSGGGGTPA